MRSTIFLLLILFSITGKAQLIPFYSGVSEKYGYKDANGKEVVAPRFDLAYPLTEGMAAVRLDGKYGYLDASGKEVVALKYDFTWHFIGGYAAVKFNGRYGFIDKTGKEVVAPIYEDANNFHGNCCYKGMAHVRDKGQWKIIKLAK